MKNINLLDCTLRDGGYINDWLFGKETIKGITQRIAQTGIEAFEIGFLKDVDYDENKTIFSSLEQIKNIITPKKNDLMYLAMLDMETPFPIEKLHRFDENSVDALRVIFKKDKIEVAYSYCEKLKNLGYKLFIQLVNTDQYNDTELVETIQKFNNLDPLALSIVDTFGLMKKKDFLRRLYILDNNLKAGVALGYHSHNNLQQAFSNAESMTELDTHRDLYIDACIFGMGRGAGNLNLELFATHLNENFEKKYRIEPMLEIIDEYLNTIYKEHFWGYSLPFYISASLGCHPNYANFFANKGTLSLKSFREILKQIPPKAKERYSKETANEQYINYLSNYIDDKDTLKRIKCIFENKNILILAPGSTLWAEETKINKYIAENKPLIISLNFIKTSIKADYVFSSNMRRYYKLQHEPNIKKIITSNIKDAEKYDFMVNFSSYSNENPEIIDNSGLMLLKLLIAIGVKRVAIAGFDGYRLQNSHNYFSTKIDDYFTEEMLLSRNKLIAAELQEISKNIDIQFVTTTLYR
jgi:4-hydroxy 2-oxovalerate aldolase